LNSFLVLLSLNGNNGNEQDDKLKVILQFGLVKRKEAYVVLLKHCMYINTSLWCKDNISIYEH